MGAQDAIMTCLRKYVDFNGRAGKAEFWWFVLAVFVVNFVLSIVGGLTHLYFLSFLSYAFLLPSLAAAVRRLHDTNRSGWWYLISLTGIGIIFLIIWWVADGTVGENRFGPDPRGAAAGAATTPTDSSWAS